MSRDNVPIAEALTTVLSDASLKETYFVTPLTLEFSRLASSRFSSPSTSNRSEPYPAANPSKGKKGKGKGKAKRSYLGAPSAKGFVYSTTPDGRQICYAYNTKKCDNKCNRVHVCQMCLGPHPRTECPTSNKQDDANAHWQDVPKPVSPSDWQLWNEGSDQCCYVLHLFAGFPREDNIRHFLTLEARAANVTLYGLEIDICRGPQYNMHDDAVWRCIQIHILSGKITLLIATPPSNTFSRARCQYRQTGGPRPLRSHQYPRGFPWLDTKNKLLVDQANQLIERSFWACKEVHLRGGHFLLGHPEHLGLTCEQMPASIWDWPDVQEILLLQDVVTFAVFQCAFQSPFKPTYAFSHDFEQSCHGLLRSPSVHWPRPIHRAPPSSLYPWRPHLQTCW